MNKRRFNIKMYPALALLIVRGAIEASELERQEAADMILAGPQLGQNYYGTLEGRDKCIRMN
jgi:hypothetical protein